MDGNDRYTNKKPFLQFKIRPLMDGNIKKKLLTVQRKFKIRPLMDGNPYRLIQPFEFLAF